MKLTVAILGLREALAQVMAECWHERDMTRKWQADSAFRELWLSRADDALADGTALASAVDRVRREAFEAGGSPAIGVLLSEVQEAGPGEYQDGLSRAILLLSQEMAQHYGSIFEAGQRVGREQARKAAGEHDGG